MKQERFSYATKEAIKSNKNYLTVEGLNIIKARLEDLRKSKESIVTEKTNSFQFNRVIDELEFDPTNDLLSLMDSRILELENLLLSSVIIYKDPNPVKVKIGSIVDILIDGEKKRFSIVGIGEVDLYTNSISFASPLGAAVLDKKIGDEVIVTAPEGNYSCKIVYIG